MTRLALATVNPRPNAASGRPWSHDIAHDIRNALSVTGLHLETLEGLAGPEGCKAASAAQAVLARAAAMCSASLAGADRSAPRRSFDLVKAIGEVAVALAPTAPDGFRIVGPTDAQCFVLGVPADIDRIIFNLVHNAIGVARRGGAITCVRIDLRRSGASIEIHVSDDGPGLPADIRATLFRRRRRGTAAVHGFGIAIARELAERNGSTLRLDPQIRGAGYVFELPVVCAVAPAKVPARR